MKSESLHQAVKRYVVNYPEMVTAEAAEAIVAGLSRGEIREAALCWVAFLYEAEDRAQVRVIERESASPQGYRRVGGKLEATTTRNQPTKPPAKAQNGRYAKLHREWQQKQDDAAQRERARHQELVTQVRAEAHMEWTAKLLGATFALGDGTRVTWGEATVEQHERRIGVLARNAAGSIETLKRHELAVADILEARAGSLGEMVEAQPLAVSA